MPSGLVLNSITTTDVEESLAADAPGLVEVPIHVVTPTVTIPTLVNGRPQ